MSCKAKLFTFLERVAFIKKQKYFFVVTYRPTDWPYTDAHKTSYINLRLSDLVHVA